MLIDDVPFDRSREYDLVVCCCGFESRASYSMRQGLQGKVRIALDLGGSRGCAFEANRKLFVSQGWELRQSDAIESILLKGGETRRVAVDISAMPRVVLARTVLALAGGASSATEVDFFYAPGEFSGSVAAARMSVTLTAGPLLPDLEGSLRATSIPIGLVVGLGAEPYRAAGLVELLEPARVWHFFAEGGDPRFTALLEEEWRASAGMRAIRGISYPIFSLQETFARLSSLVFSQSRGLRMIIAPSGPKLFSLASLLVALDTESPYRPAVWRVGGAAPMPCVDVPEAGPVSVSRVRFGM